VWDDEAPLTMYAPHVSNLSHLDASRRYRQTAKLDAQTNKRTNKQTNSFTDKVKVEWDAPRVVAKRLVYQMPVQGRRTTLLDAITQAHSTAHMQQNATRIIPLPNSLLPGTFFFIHLWTFTSSTVSQLVFWIFFVDLFFFSLQPSIGGIWVYVWDLYLFRVWWCWI